jgi:hypothetical protein
MEKTEKTIPIRDAILKAIARLRACKYQKEQELSIVDVLVQGR